MARCMRAYPSPDVVVGRLELLQKPFSLRGPSLPPLPAPLQSEDGEERTDGRTAGRRAQASVSGLDGMGLRAALAPASAALKAAGEGEGAKNEPERTRSRDPRNRREGRAEARAEGGMQDVRGMKKKGRK